jgi:hypothetical protein
VTAAITENGWIPMKLELIQMATLAGTHLAPPYQRMEAGFDKHYTETTSGEEHLAASD